MTIRYATWPRRAAAYLIDYALLVPLALIVTFVGNNKVQLWCAIADVLMLVGNRWLLAGYNGRTIGRTVMRIKMVGASSGKPIGLVAACYRDVLHVLDTLSLCIGWIRPLWQRKHQTIADSIVKAAVLAEQQ